MNFQTSQLPGEDAAEVIYQLGTFGWHFLIEGPFGVLGSTKMWTTQTHHEKSMGISKNYRNWWNKYGVTNSSLDDGTPACLMNVLFLFFVRVTFGKVCLPMAPEANCCRGIELHSNRALYLTTEYEIVGSGQGKPQHVRPNMYKLVNDASSWPKSLWVVLFLKRLNASWWKILPSHFSQVPNCVCLKGDPEDPSEETWLTVFLTNISNVVQFRDESVWLHYP